MPDFKNRKNECIKHEGKSYWIGRNVACTAVVAALTADLDQPVYMLGLRGPAMMDYPFYWNNIAGYLDWDESTTQGISRELWEEAGIDVAAEAAQKNILNSAFDQPWKVNSDPSNNRQNITMEHAILFWSKPQTIVNNCGDGEEVLELKWFTFAELDAIKDKIAFNHYFKIKEFHETLYPKWAPHHE